ncbi:unnamed protein product [Arctia plantaginis]|uniref:BHLH domain-containing protein n=1 Tax=Arctia plantaginis TaxID=874455 RepID=A0A8S1BIR8_ARCPL|nr:unnamed protein product [Arctia plantaginis]
MKSEQPIRTASGPSDRRRGRPVGRNRVPLTIEERRARNALYEQERRNDVANAYSELAAVLSVDSNVAHAELLEETLSFIKERTEKSEEDTIMKRQNAKLEWQIQKLTEEVTPFQHGAEAEGDHGDRSE